MKFSRNVLVTGALVIGCMIGGGAAWAASAVGPPTQNPGFGEYNYAPGTVVYGCVDQATETVRIEVRTQTADNCRASEVQIAFQIPSVAYPSPAVTPSSTPSG